MSYTNPFIKVEWEDTPENLTQERIKRVKEYFKKKYNATDIKIITKVSSNTSTTKLKSLEASDNILDPQYQKNLIKDFMTENQILVKWELIDRLDNRVNGEIDKIAQNRVRYNKWFLKKIEFSNLLSFGDDNIIDFTDLEGITVVESNPKNFGGKTTFTVDLLLFLFFNTTTKTKTAIEIFNRFRDCDEVKVKGYVEIDGENYIIERKIIRKKSKSGDYTTKNELEFYKIDADGTVTNLSGEQRRETEVFISSAIGTEEDFLSTILTTGHNLEEMIDAKPTARGAILTRFLGLESLKVKEETCKTIYSEWSKKLVSNTYNIVQLETDNGTYTLGISESEAEVTKLGDNLKTYDITLKELESKRDAALQSKNNDIDQELIRTNPVLLKREIDDAKVKHNNLKEQGKLITVIEPSKYYSEDEHNELRKEIDEIGVRNGILWSDIVRNEKLVTQLETGSVCPTCKRSLEGVDHSSEIAETKELVISLKTTRDQNLVKIEELKVKEAVFLGLKKEFEEYERNKLRKAKFELDVEKSQLEIDKNQSRLDNYDKNKSKLEANQRIDGEVIILKTKIDTLNADIRLANVNIEKHKNNILNLNEKIKINLDLIKKIKAEEELISVFKTYLLIFGKNGISKVIMKNMIPLLNQELHRILSDSCYFTLELNINDKNELEFLMIDNETRVVKSLISGSGYEKTIASLAIRSVLTKVSSLPKPNIVVMDEVFGKIADENLELVGEFFKKIKNYFEHIFVISHNPLIRNWSDNLVVVKKDENVSFIEQVIPKIS
jgi:DNA repair exonuclease SbcCD ATPase subunit